nr:MAG TPA: hypothetical protein [Caudoviricetes sp.]
MQKFLPPSNTSCGGSAFCVVEPQCKIRTNNSNNQIF